MPRDNNGNYSLPTGTLVNAGDTILVSQHNPAMQDIAASLTGSLARDGRGGMLADLPANGHRITGLGAGIQPNDAATVGQLGTSGVPIGGAVEYYGETLPDSTWLWADGSAVSRSSYPVLFERYGTRYGPGDGVTTFNLPDRRGRTSIGMDRQVGGSYADRVTDPILDARTLGATGGAQSVALTVAQLPKHSHSGTTGSSGQHSHSVAQVLNEMIEHDGSPEHDSTVSRTATQQTGQAGAHTHTFTTNETGSGDAHPNVQPAIVCNYIIKARIA